MTLNLKQILNDLQEEKGAIDDTIVALERLLMRQRKASRQMLTESLSALHAEKRTATVASKKRNDRSGSPRVPESPAIGPIRS